MESPLVSIIVPIYNAAMDMVPCLEVSSLIHSISLSSSGK